MKMLQGRNPKEDGFYVAYIDNGGSGPDLNLLQYKNGSWSYQQSVMLPYRAPELIVGYVGPIPKPQNTEFANMTQKASDNKEVDVELKLGDIVEATDRATNIRTFWKVVKLGCDAGDPFLVPVISRSGDSPHPIFFGNLDIHACL